LVFENPNFLGCQIATSKSVKQHKLRKLIACLSDTNAPKKDFVTLYIAKETPIDGIIADLKKASDYKSENSLPNVLRNIIQYLKQLKQNPENGLALFAGIYGQTQDSQSEFEMEEVIPPEPIVAYFFKVDDHFHLEPLRDMLRNQRVVGLIAIDSKEASYGLLNGERLEIIETITSGIHGKSGKGGSSQRRYEREREMALTGYFHRVADHAAKAFLENHTVTALVLGGPGETKMDFEKGNYLHYELQNALLSIVDTQSAGRDAIKEILDKSSEERQNMCAPEERNMMQRLLTSMGKQDGLAIYGLDPVLEALKTGLAEVALVTDTTDTLEIVYTCKNCGLSKTKIVYESGKVAGIQEQISTPCQRCRAVEYDVLERDIIDVLEDAASQTNARVEVISTESPEKDKLTALSGFAALLRYKHS
jgi:peptide chain release factor subunit 1